MSVIGLPLLLALFQFINDHEYQSPDEQIRLRTFLYAVLMVASAFLLWGLYFTALCVIKARLGTTSLTAILFLFMWILLAIILVILWIQLEQMIGDRHRYSLLAYLLALFSFLIAIYHIFQGNVESGIFFITLAVSVAAWGLIAQYIGLEKSGERVVIGLEKFGERVVVAWEERRANNEENDDS